mmetsp:Transcript_18281/g.42779  ORF Transcript_18281/g.42779 Transcript_18281/m.42779 type:complete len:818 (-) Transcript_18281:196-2649(-)
MSGYEEYVEIHGLDSPLIAENGRSLAPDLLNGLRGRCLYLLEDEVTYVVQTFTGIEVHVHEDNLRACEPLLPEDGGFNVTWPPKDSIQTPVGDVFGQEVCQVLRTQGYCVVEMCLDADTRESALDEASRKRDYEQVLADVEAGYLGIDNSSKFVSMDLAAIDDIAETTLQALDQQLTTLGSVMMSSTAESLSFPCWGRGNALLRVPRVAEDPEPREAQPSSLEDITMVKNYLQWAAVRKVSMLYIVAAEGGNLSFVEKETSQEKVTIPLQSGKLVLFRHDLLDYSYQAEGKSLALQAWLLGDPNLLQVDGLPAYAETESQPLQDMQIKGPPMPEGECANVMSVCPRFPSADIPEEWWSMVVGCTDLQIYTPSTRFDMDLYYDSDYDRATLTGRAYSPHSSFISEEQITQFDPHYFGMGLEEGAMLSPHHRVLLEEGVRALYQAGCDPDSLDGQYIGVHLGEAANEWGGTTYTKYGLSPDYLAVSDYTISCSRLSYQLGLRGPTTTHDTACSSSIVALSTAHHMMRSRTNIGGRIIQLQPDALTMKVALVGSPSLYTVPSGWIGECAAGMLGVLGRTHFTEARADGFVRGEGAAMMALKWCSSSDEDAASRFGILTGSALNQDGRSATLTAPNGPAQQECGRTSMREAGIKSTEVNMHECHGTGTALGDPIEIGALKAIYIKGREMPCWMQGVKSNAGHLEACAGLAGLIKVVSLIRCASAAPNVHLTCLNPHIDEAGFPAQFPTELSDAGNNALNIGLSSFGFGGTNSRADVWGVASLGHRKVSRQVVLDDRVYLKHLATCAGGNGENLDKLKSKLV